jgi:hypothetical protein
MGHIWLGFAEDQVTRMFEEAGFEKVRIVPLAPDARAKGPGLFVATGERSSAEKARPAHVEKGE